MKYLIMAALISGCTDRVNQCEFEKAVKVCKEHDGLKFYRPNAMLAVCKNQYQVELPSFEVTCPE